jgi:uncharacterized NAD(P)/FAD-binding protein YdhS
MLTPHAESARRVAVIGGGAAAVSLLDSLLRQVPEEAPARHVTIYEPTSLARGRAYRPDLDCALINRQAGYMSIRADERRHFLNWLNAGSGGYGIESYVPRHLFGDYLDAQLARCRAEATRRGWSVAVRPELALGAHRHGAGWQIRGEHSVEQADAIVLCVGTGVPGDPFRLTGAPGFVPDCYPLRSTIPAVPARAHVLILGTGLSAVDCVLALRAVGHEGPITLGSRRGVLPGVRAWPYPLTLQHLTVENIGARAASTVRLTLTDVVELLKMELRAVGLDPAKLWRLHPPEADPREYLRHQLDQESGNPLQTIAMLGLLNVRMPIWSALSDSDRQTVAERFNTQLKSQYNPMPPPSGRTLLEAMETGRLRTMSGVRSVRSRPTGGFVMTAGDGEIHADVVIDTTRTGLGTLSSPARRFLSSLVDAGFAAWHPQGGLRVDPRDGATGEHRSIFAIGEITAGQMFFASSMFMINSGANRVAGAIAERDAPACPR